LASFTPEGRKLPPIFDPQADPTDPTAATLFGSADAPTSVLRIARRTPVLVCVGGLNADTACASARDCPGGVCVPTFRACASGARVGRPSTPEGDCEGAPCGPASWVGAGKAGQPCRTAGHCRGGESGPPLFAF